jgi:hypothetical protein
VREEDHDIASIIQLGLDRIDRKRNVNALLSRRMGWVIPILQGTQLRPHDSRVFGLPHLCLSAGCVVTKSIVLMRWKAPVNLHTDETPGVTTAIGGCEESTKPIRTEVAPLDWHTL